MKEINKIKEESEDIIAEIRGEALNKKEKQLAKIKELETKLSAAQTDLSNEKQARQRVEKERDQRPNITFEDYERLLDELEKLKNGLGGKTLEQVQIELNKISELEKRPTLEQLDGLTEKNTQLQQQIGNLQDIINKLPAGLIGENEEIDEKSLTLLTNLSETIRKLENERLENELKESQEKVKRLEEDKNKGSGKQFLEEIKVLVGEEDEEINVLEKLLAEKRIKSKRLKNRKVELENELEGGGSKLSELTEANTRLQEQISDLQQQLKDTLANKKPELSSPKVDTESKAKKVIQTELDKFSNIKIEEIGDEEFLSLHKKFKKMKNWILAGNDEETEAAINKQSELKEINIVEDIYQQRPKHKYIIDLINEGKEAIEHKNVDLANEVLDDLKFLEKKEKQAFFSKIVEINRLKKEMRPLIQSQQAQIVQTDQQVEKVTNNFEVSCPSRQGSGLGTVAIFSGVLLMQVELENKLKEVIRNKPFNFAEYKRIQEELSRLREAELPEEIPLKKSPPTENDFKKAFGVAAYSELKLGVADSLAAWKNGWNYYKEGNFNDRKDLPYNKSRKELGIWVQEFEKVKGGYGTITPESRKVKGSTYDKIPISQKKTLAQGKEGAKMKLIDFSRKFNISKEEE
ncbi:3755_t:CDS:2, partial [Ambispora leptoticha]